MSDPLNQIEVHSHGDYCHNLDERSTINDHQDGRFNDPLLKLEPIVRITRLPDHLFDCCLPASYIEEIYSVLEERSNPMNKRKLASLDDEVDYKKWAESCKRLTRDPIENQNDHLTTDGGLISFLSSPSHMNGQNDQQIDLHGRMTKPDEDTKSSGEFIFLSSDESSQSSSITPSDNPCSVLSTMDPSSHDQSFKITSFPEYKLTLLPWLKFDPSLESKCKIEDTLDFQMDTSVPTSSPMSPDSKHVPLSPFWTLQTNAIPQTTAPDYSPSLHIESDDDAIEIAGIEKMDFDRTNNHIPFNWLDVSKVKIQLVLVVEAIDENGRLTNGSKTKFIFKSIYDKFGKYPKEVTYIRTERNYIKLYFDDPQIRTKIKDELDEIILKNRLNYHLIVRGSQLENPVIHFVTDLLIDRRNQFEWIDLIKKLNVWPEDSLVIWKSTSQMNNGLYRVKIIVDSKIRSMIQEAKGLISIDHRAVVDVIDDLNLIQCYRCFDYGHGKFSCKRYHRKCFFCGDRLHIGSCPIRNRPDQWYCGFCKVKGHSAVSKECPVLLKFLKPELERFNHKYNFVFLDHDLGRRLCDDILCNQKLKTVGETKLQSLVDSLIDSRMIKPKHSGKIYQKLKDHLEKAQT